MYIPYKMAKVKPGMTMLVGALISAAVLVGAYMMFAGLKQKTALVARTNPSTLPDKAKADALETFVKHAADQAAKLPMGNKAFERLDGMRGPGGAYLIGYSTQEIDDVAKGTMLFHGVPTTTFCDDNHPECDAKDQKMVGKNLYDFKTVGGVYEVRLWLDIAKEGGGWATTYWKDQWGRLRPKYYYIAPVEDRPYLIASGYFA